MIRSIEWHLREIELLNKKATEMIEAERYALIKEAIVSEVSKRLDRMSDLLRRLGKKWEEWDNEIKETGLRILNDLHVLSSIPRWDCHYDLWTLTGDAYAAVRDLIHIIEELVEASRLIAEAEDAGLSLKIENEKLCIEGENHEGLKERLIDSEKRIIELIREKNNRAYQTTTQ